MQSNSPPSLNIRLSSFYAAVVCFTLQKYLDGCYNTMLHAEVNVDQHKCVTTKHLYGYKW